MAASALIEVDPYRKGQRGNNNNRTANVSAIDFDAGRGKTGVDLRWHPKSEFKKLTDDQKDELMKWMKTSEGRKVLKESRDQAEKKRKKEGGSDVKKTENGNWKKKFKKALGTPKGLAHVMAVMAEEEKNNQALIAAIQAIQAPVLPPPPAANQVAQPRVQIASTTATAPLSKPSMPATALKLASILKKK